MDEQELAKRRILELADRASTRGILTHTDFLPSWGPSLLKELADEGKADLAKGTVLESSYFFYGGSEENESQVLFFLPDYLSKEEEKAHQAEGEVIACLHIEAKKAAFAEILTHRDYLGALMSLGYERKEFGDILVEGADAYVFLFKDIAEEVMKNLLSVKHTYIKSVLLAPKDCPVVSHFEEKMINIASPRLDAVIGEVYGLSRQEAVHLIEGGQLFLEGEVYEKAPRLLTGGEKISLRGYGKFVYLGEEKLSKKGRLFAKVKLYQ